MFLVATHAATRTPAITIMNHAHTIVKAAVATRIETAGAAKLKLF